MAGAANINDLLDGHVTLDLECLDRVYLNAYVPNLQVSGQVVTFLCRHLGYPVPSPALFNKIGDRLPQGGGTYAEPTTSRWCASSKGDRKVDVMKPT